MTVRIELVDPLAVMPQIASIMEANWSETGFDFEFAPSAETYGALHSVGLLFALVARRAGQIVGYSTAVVTPHPFNPSVVVCNSDALFVLPEHRTSSAGAKLIVATEAEARVRGAVRMFWHTRAGTELARVLERRDYRPADITVMRTL